MADYCGDEPGIVRNRRGDIDVERSSLGAVLRAEAGPPPRDCDSCPQDVAMVLDRSRHRWDCPNHPRHTGPEGRPTAADRRSVR